MKLIKLSAEHYIIVDDSEIKEGDYILMNWSIIRQCDYIDGYMLIDTTQGKHHISVCDKITHSTQPDKGMDNVTFISLSEVKELTVEVDVEKKAKQDAIELFGNDFSLASLSHQTEFKRGYYQALEDNKDRKYTEEDMRVAIRLATTSKYDHILEFYSEADILQSLQPPTSWDVTFVDGKLKLI